MSNRDADEHTLDISGSLLPKLARLTGYKDPFRFSAPEQFQALLLEAKAHNASDIFIQPHTPVCARVNGGLVALTERPVDEGEVKTILKWVAGRDTAQTDIVSGVAVNARYELFDPFDLDDRGARVRYGYRVNASPIMSPGTTSAQIVMRMIPSMPPTIADVGVSEEIAIAATPRDGIVYVGGATGSGKSTTMAAFVRYVLENDTPIKGNIITHEEPIEFRFDRIPSKHSIVVQSQIPTHFKDFYDANREAMRRKPSLIVTGEMRDEETIRTAVEASLTGHPVMGTVHATKVKSIFRRLISRFPESERPTAIFDVIDSVKFMLAQRLVPSINGKLVAAREYLAFDESMRDELLNLTDMGRVTDRLNQLVMTKGHSFEAEAKRLMDLGLIDDKVARELAN